MEFQQTELYTAIINNNVEAFNEQLLRNDVDFHSLDTNYQTYLHVGVINSCDVTIVSGLIPRVRLGQRDASRLTALDYALRQGGEYGSAVMKLHTDYILQWIKDGEYDVLWQLATDGWMHWPVKGNHK
jgi:ankyrin repeat protein